MSYNFINKIYLKKDKILITNSAFGFVTNCNLTAVFRVPVPKVFNMFKLTKLLDKNIEIKFNVAKSNIYL